MEEISNKANATAITPIQEKSFKFAVRIVNLHKYLIANYSDFVISKQLFRCGTSIGANIAESRGAQSDADFIAKVHISLKEAKETEYWLKLLHHTNYINDDMMTSLSNDLDEIIALTIKTLKSTKSRLNKK